MYIFHVTTEKTPKCLYRGCFRRFYLICLIFVSKLPCISQNINFAKLTKFFNIGYIPFRGNNYFFDWLTATTIIAITNINIIGITNNKDSALNIINSYSVTASNAALIFLTGTISILTFIFFERDL